LALQAAITATEAASQQSKETAAAAPLEPSEAEAHKS
jgi:hypothetical protein